jgi:cell wall-associated NlpC family hydrolase
VARSGVVLDPNASMWSRYQSFAEEMKQKPSLPEERPIPPPSRPGPGAGAKTEPVPAPFPGDPLVPLAPDWSQALTQAVDGWLGVPYKWGGTTKAGVDCSGFVQAVVRDSLAIQVPRSARVQADHGVPVQRPALKKGDLVFFDTLDRGHITHVGIYMGDGKMAHAGCTKGVTYAPLAKSYYQQAFRAARRIATN